MISFKITFLDGIKNVLAAADKAAAKSMGHAAGSLAKSARESIKLAPKEQRSGSKSRGGRRVGRARHAASPAGTPPYTQRKLLPRSIVYAVAADGRSAIVGPTAKLVGTSGSAHEFGGSYKGQTYPARPFMAPALTRTLAKFAGAFAGSIGE